MEIELGSIQHKPSLTLDAQRLRTLASLVSGKLIDKLCSGRISDHIARGNRSCGFWITIMACRSMSSVNVANILYRIHLQSLAKYSQVNQRININIDGCNAKGLKGQIMTFQESR
jgi:hypothetical protein